MAAEGEKYIYSCKYCTFRRLQGFPEVGEGRGGRDSGDGKHEQPVRMTSFFLPTGQENIYICFCVEKRISHPNTVGGGLVG